MDMGAQRVLLSSQLCEGEHTSDQLAPQPNEGGKRQREEVELQSPVKTEGAHKKRKLCDEFKGKPICKAFNDARGCAAGSCPKGMAHVCDMQRPDGSPCRSSQHTRYWCPLNGKQF